jgi:hypothetical protein
MTTTPKALYAGAAIERSGDEYRCRSEVPCDVLSAPGSIKMHRGSDPRKGRAPSTWLTHELLFVVQAELETFQKSPFSCRENAIALTHIETAILWLAARAERREAECKLGTQVP